MLENDTELGDQVREHIRQGSWANRTIIKPLNNHKFDADVLLRLDEVPEWTEQQDLDEVWAALRRSSTYRDRVKKKHRCIRVIYAGDCHVDVVPHVHLADGRQVIVNYEEATFEETNPEGFTAWMKERDTLAHRNLRKVLRLLKYLRGYKQTFSAPLVILTLLVAERVTAWDADERYKDVPTALKNLLDDLDSWLQMYGELPPLEDPSCPGTTFNHRWDQVAGVVGVAAAVGCTTSLLARPGRSQWGETQRAIAAGAATAAVGLALIGLLPILGPGALAIAATVIAVSSSALHQYVAMSLRFRRWRLLEVVPLAAPVAVDRLERPESSTLFAPSTPVCSLTDSELCLAWRASHAALRRAERSCDLIEQVRLVAARQAYLDELERRDPGWLRPIARRRGSTGQ